MKDRASSYHKESRVRKDCCFIYEEFKATDGTDVKVSLKECYLGMCWVGGSLVYKQRHARSRLRVNISSWICTQSAHNCTCVNLGKSLISFIGVIFVAGLFEFI